MLTDNGQGLSTDFIKRLADDVLFLHHGKLAEHSPAKSFFQKPKSAAARAYLAGKLVL